MGQNLQQKVNTNLTTIFHSMIACESQASLTPSQHRSGFDNLCYYPVSQNDKMSLDASPNTQTQSCNCIVCVSLGCS